MVYFTYDKAEFSCRFNTIKNRLITGDESVFALERGERFYKQMLNDKFGINNIGFNRIYKYTTKSNKKTYACDIYNIETREEVCGVFIDNLKKRGYWFKTSSGEDFIKNELNNAKVSYISQKTFDDCLYKDRLRFDFYLPNLNVLIEYDGIQHSEPIEAFGGEEGFEQNKIRDEVKNQYCKEKNIKLIRIPYYNFDKIPQIIQDIVSTN